MPYGKSRPENRFRNEAAFFIGQMEVQIRVNQSVTDGEYGIYGFYSFRGSQGVPMKALTELKGGIRVSKIRRMAFPSEASLLGVPVPCTLI